MDIKNIALAKAIVGKAVGSIEEEVAQLTEEINNIPDPPDVSAFITRAVNDLENYYRKDETYTCEEIDGRISAIPKFTISVVSSLPTVDISETTIYLLRDGVDGNMYTEHIYVGGTWEILGSQRVDLTGYATQTWTLEQLKGYQPKGNYALKSELPAVPTNVSAFTNDAGYAKKSELPAKLSDLSEDSTHRVVTDAEKAAWSGKSNFSGNYADLNGKPTIPTVPTKVSAFENDRGYLTEHQDISGKLDANKLPEAVNTALAQAKASGEFDGQDGQDGQPGADGSDGADGKSAYQYAVEGGYKGSEAEFTEKLAAEIPEAYTLPAATADTLGGVMMDDTLTQSGRAADAAAVGAKVAQLSEKADKFDPTVYGVPMLYLTGSIDGMTKDNPVTLSYSCKDAAGTARAGTCTVKWQGSSSLAYEKKNYTISFDTAFEAVEGWGAQKKYCLKANFIDHSHARNVVCAKLWGQVVKSRTNVPTELSTLPNGGAIDGFPVVIMLNGEFHGLYSFNIPKDGWMFGMGSGEKEAIVGADNPADDTAFKAETALDAEGMELEYASESFAADQIKKSLNTLINACINSWGGDLDDVVAQYIDWDSVIDYYLFTVLINGDDMALKNYLLATFDGVKWYMSAYDMDSTCGLRWDGKYFYGAHEGLKFWLYQDMHRLMELVYRFKTDALKNRWAELRSYHYSETRLCRLFENYVCTIPTTLLAEDVKRWPTIPSSAVNDVNQILRWLLQRVAIVDEWVQALPAQEKPIAPDEPSEGYTNLVPTSTDTDGSVYNGVGYKNDTRLSSSGSVSGEVQAGSVTVGFFPATRNSVICVKGGIWLGTTGHYYIAYYDATKTKLYVVSRDSYDANAYPGMTITYDEETGVTTFENVDAYGEWWNMIENTAYIRINVYGEGADLIVTVDQEIT